ncbi:hypothetical protein ES703_29713 [subsurface metagenome]
MMENAYVLITTEMIDRHEEALQALRDNGSIKEAYAVSGVYSIIAILEAESMVELKNTVSTDIRGLPGVKSTLTMVVTS